MMEKETIKLDKSITDISERLTIVQKIVNDTPSDKLSPRYLEQLATYLIESSKEAKKEKKTLTENQMITINKREMSYEGLVSKFENGEDSIYNLIANDKNIIFSPKVSITLEDLDKIPDLRPLYDAIQDVKQQYEAATGKRRSALLKSLIEMRKDQYVIKNAFLKPIYFMNVRKSFHKITLDEKIILNDDGTLTIKGLFSLLNPDHVSLLLCNYAHLKEEVWSQLNSDTYYLLLDLENLIDNTLKDKQPLLFDLIVHKIDKLTNEEIQTIFQKKYHIKYSTEYISSLWRKKIPKILSEQATKDYLTWYYTEKEKGKWKKCSRCKTIKLAHNMFFSKNKTSKDSFYSICKECRNKKIILK